MNHKKIQEEQKRTVFFFLIA